MLDSYPVACLQTLAYQGLSLDDSREPVQSLILAVLTSGSPPAVFGVCGFAVVPYSEPAAALIAVDFAGPDPGPVSVLAVVPESAPKVSVYQGKPALFSGQPKGIVLVVSNTARVVC